MKNFLTLLISFLTFVIIVKGQPCDYNSSNPITIGQILINDEDCPYNGRITINNVSGGGGNYVYEITNGPITRIVQSQHIFNTLTGGNYTIRVSSCNGLFKDTSVFLNWIYDPMSAFKWSITKIGGFTCGTTNNGVFKVYRAASNGIGKAPHRYQINNINSFSGVPYEGTLDTAIFNNLNTNTTYYLRITDACNQVIVKSFNTGNTTAPTTLAEPTLQITPSYPYKCEYKGKLTIRVNDLATGNPYIANFAKGNFAYWGTLADPYVRIQVKNSSNNTVYFDNNCKISSISGYPYLDKMYSIDGETGLSASNQIFYSSVVGIPLTSTTTINQFYIDSIPANEPLTVSLYFPGGNQCGTVIPAAVKTFNTTIVANDNPPPTITVAPSCIGSKYFLVTPSTSFYGRMKLIELGPPRKVIVEAPSPQYTGAGFNGGLGYQLAWGNLVVGKTYRVLWEDNCGRKDSVDLPFNPSFSSAPPITISDSVAVFPKCVYNAADSMYQLRIRPLPAAYLINAIEINGNNVNFSTIQWAGFPNTMWGAKVETLLPTGSYNYTIHYSNACMVGSYNGVFTTPAPTTPAYTRDVLVTTTTTAQTCFQNGFTTINVTGYVKKGNTNYSMANLRLLSAPHNGVFPLLLKNNPIPNGFLTANNQHFQYGLNTNYLTGDSIFFIGSYRGLILKPGQEGTYIFAMDILCADGSFIETVTKSITINTIPAYAPSYLSLEATSALVCDGGSDLRINMQPIGGVAPFYYEYKLESASVYTATPSAGTQSFVLLNSIPPAGTIYDIQVTDGCGNVATAKVSTASFTGQFYLTAYIPDCNSPFVTRIRTASIHQAYYTWKRNGTIIAQGYNLYEITITGLSQDEITVEVDMFGCYFRSTTVTLVYNPGDCKVSPLSLRLNSFKVQNENKTTNTLKWITQNEVNNSHFEIEKSDDGNNFTKIGEVSAYNNLNNNYTYSDNNFLRDKAYYRLKIIDNTRKFFYSEIVVIKAINSVSQIRISPNPVKFKMNLYFAAPVSKKYTVAIYNALGKLISKNAFAFIKNGSSIDLDIENLSNGNYYIQILDGQVIKANNQFIKL